MALNYDIALLNNDLLIDNGDFAIGESDEQHIVDTINAFPGWWKEDAPDGVGLLQYIRSSGKQQEIARSVKLQLQSDGYQVSNPTVTIDPDGLMIINPNAKKN
jgi:hypothetical protein